MNSHKSDCSSQLRNARDHSKSQLAALENSFAAFGVISPMIIDSNNRIVAGHRRVDAAKPAGLTMIPTLRIAHLSDA
jgi:ParB-like chromosome segregation protein Spo0J